MYYLLVNIIYLEKFVLFKPNTTKKQSRTFVISPVGFLTVKLKEVLVISCIIIFHPVAETSPAEYVDALPAGNG
jgi:hypothetical protein